MTDYNVWRTIETNEFYKQYLDVKKKQELKSDIYLQGLSVAEQIKKLSDGISVLDKELQKQVLSRHEDLLSQATWMEKLEAVLAVMQVHVQSLLSAMERLRTKIVEPFSKVELQTVMLSRLHATSDLLRRVARIQHLTNRLNSQMAQGFSGSSLDIIKAAQSLNELAQLSEDVDLSGLEVLEEDQRSIRTHRSEVERQGKLMLTQGLQSQNHAQVSTAIQVFHQLDTLKQSALQVVQLAEQNLSEEIKQALDLNILTHTVSSDAKTRAVPGRVPLTTSNEVSAFRSRLWVTLDHVYDLIYSNCCQVELLQRVLSRKLRDVGSTTAPHSLSYLDLLPADNRQLARNFWLAVTTTLATRLHHLAHKSSFVKQALEGEYPKFLSHYLELCKRLQTTCQLNSQSEFGMSGSDNKSQATVFEINRDVVAKFEATYLSRSESRLLDPVDLMFSGKTVPTHEEVDAVIRDMASQLSASLVDVWLIRTVAQNISKIIRMFCSKCEAMIITDGEATQVIDVCTPGQMLNVSIANLLYYLNRQVLRVFSNMKSSIPNETFSMVIDSLSEVDTITENILKPLLASVADSIEAIILTMHNEDYSMSSVTAATTQVVKKPDAACSLYMKELQGFISRAVNNYLAKFDNQEIVSKCCIPVASRCVELFLQHACLIRPLGEGGRMKLASDFAQVELAVAPLCPQLSELGQLYRLLRSFRPLLFQTVEDVAMCSTLGDVVPYSLVLLSLFARGPEQLLSPHQSASWSVSRFSHWLDTHRSERERLELMSGALQRYQQTVRQKGDTSFHPVYPVMISLLERGIAHAAMQA